MGNYKITNFYKNAKENLGTETVLFENKIEKTV